MDTHIALLIKWIKNPKSVTRKELIDNANVALADSPTIGHSITVLASVSAADSVVSAAKSTNKVANIKLSKLAYNRTINFVNTYLSTNRLSAH